MKNTILSAALTYAEAGIAVFPTRKNKTPCTEHGFNDATIDRSVIEAWWQRWPDAQVGVTGIECIDIDNRSYGVTADDLLSMVAAETESIAPGLFDTLLIERTQNGGYHIVFRCEEPSCSNQKLALRPPTEEELDENPHCRYVTIIEHCTRVLCSPSDGYEVIQGEWPHLQTVSAKERDILFGVARVFDAMPVREPVRMNVSTNGNALTGDRPGDAFNTKTNGSDVIRMLEENGWTYRNTVNMNHHMTRPGKKTGTSGTVRDDGVFYCFSANASPFNCDESYTPFGVYTTLYHNNDYQSAAKSLVADTVSKKMPPIEKDGWYYCPETGQSLMCGPKALVSFNPDKSVAYWYTPDNYDQSEYKRKQDATRFRTQDPKPTSLYDDAPKLFRAADARKHIREMEWIVPGVVARNAISQLFAAPGVGKSFMALDIALTVAQHMPVVYIAAEAVSEMPDRIDAWTAHHGVGTGQLYIYDKAIHLANATEVDTCITYISSVSPAVIIIDPLAECLAGLEESKTGDMMIALDGIKRMRDATGAGIFIVHHTGWSTEHERGSSGLRGACRTVLKLKDDDGFLTLSCEKANNNKVFDARFFKRESVLDSAVLVPANELSMARDNAITKNQLEVLKVLGLLQFEDGARNVDIVETTGITRQNVNKIIHALMRKNWIIKTGLTYTLSVAGREELIKAQSRHEIGPIPSGAKNNGTFSWEVCSQAPENTLTTNSGGLKPSAEFVVNDVVNVVNGVVTDYNTDYNTDYTYPVVTKYTAIPGFDDIPSVHPEVCSQAPENGLTTNSGGLKPSVDFVVNDVVTVVNDVVNAKNGLTTSEFGDVKPNDEKPQAIDAANVVNANNHVDDAIQSSCSQCSQAPENGLTTNSGGLKPSAEFVVNDVVSDYNTDYKENSPFVVNVVSHTLPIYRECVTTPLTTKNEASKLTTTQQSLDAYTKEEIREELYRLAPVFEKKTGRAYKDIDRIPDVLLRTSLNNLIMCIGDVCDQ